MPRFDAALPLQFLHRDCYGEKTLQGDPYFLDTIPRKLGLTYQSHAHYALVDIGLKILAQCGVVVIPHEKTIDKQEVNVYFPHCAASHLLTLLRAERTASKWQSDEDLLKNTIQSRMVTLQNGEQKPIKALAKTILLTLAIGHEIHPARITDLIYVRDMGAHLQCALLLPPDPDYFSTVKTTQGFAGGKDLPPYQRQQLPFYFEPFMQLKGMQIFDIVHNDFARTHLSEALRNTILETLKNRQLHYQQVFATITKPQTGLFSKPFSSGMGLKHTTASATEK